MHYVDRGRRPLSLEDIRRRYTQRWVNHYCDGRGRLPNDSYWRTYISILRNAFHDICGYCETRCRGEVDHFRPKAVRPDLVYSWENWVFSCHDCNRAKGAKWPKGGYVNPCACWAKARPENQFTFDTRTGEILPADRLDAVRRSKAMKTIVQLELNSQHHLKSRRFILRVAEGLLSSASDPLTAEEQDYFELFISRRSPFSSLCRTWLAERGVNIDSAV